jgi:hypothetical protein
LFCLFSDRTSIEQDDVSGEAISKPLDSSEDRTRSESETFI